MKLPMNTELRPLLLQYFPAGNWHELNIQGKGVNNTTRFLQVGDERFVLRIYETHRDEEKIRFEHAVLEALANTNLPFHTPTLFHHQHGRSIGRMPNGKLAAIFRYAEGSPPTLEDPAQIYRFGAAAARLDEALAHIQTDLPPVYPPYYELDQAYPQCSLEKLQSLCMDPPDDFASHAQALSFISPYIDRLRRQVEEVRRLPHQLIHGDLNGSNALADETGEITAILDFEFVTYDLRVMEVAVFLSDLIRADRSAERSLERAGAFLSGYLSCTELSEDELDALPTLILLRRLDVLIHFICRYWDGIDDRTIVLQQISNLYAMTRWLKDHETSLRQLFNRK